VSVSVVRVVQGGAAANVSNTISGDVVTGGNESRGVLAQSVGGGGGAGGFNVSAGLTATKQMSGNLGVGLGGSGGGGGSAGDVSNSMTGDVTTAGNDSGGMLVQSLGGGGGAGGLNVTGGVALSKSSSGNIGVGLGGSGGDGGDGASVDSTVMGIIETDGASSAGLVVQSLGGGGGSGALNVTGGLSGGQETTANIGVGIGGTGGGGGDSSCGSDPACLVVDSTFTGSISTLGKDSSAYVAQSLGGGGGDGGLNVTGGIAISTKGTGGNIGVGIGGMGGSGGSSGNVRGQVTISEGSEISTVGEKSGGVLAQSGRGRRR
jgi:hypothetical protein